MVQQCIKGVSAYTKRHPTKFNSYLPPPVFEIGGRGRLRAQFERLLRIVLVIEEVVAQNLRVKTCGDCNETLFIGLLSGKL